MSTPILSHETVELVDVHHASGCPGRTVVEDVGSDLVRGYHALTCSPWAEVGVFHLILANPRALPEPIPYQGGLGLRRLDEAATAAVRGAIA